VTLRSLNEAILRSAALIVPATERAEWFAEWRAELCYVNRDATAFCLGSFRDALWLRSNNPTPTNRALRLQSPVRCALSLAVMAALSMLLAFGLRPRVKSSPMPEEDLALAWIWVFVLSLLILSTVTPLKLGEYPANRYAPSVVIRLRRWLFLFLKVGLLVSIACFGCFALAQVAEPLAPATMFLGLHLGFRWALTDQRKRCPVCLRLLTNPISIGGASQAFLGWYGTELICTHGHGLLYVPGTSTSWCCTQRWQYLDPTWSSLRP
jgi:hypothetical protein